MPAQLPASLPRFARALFPCALLLCAVFLCANAGCAHPAAIDDESVLREVASRFSRFYPRAPADPDPARDLGLLRPRFGLPAIIGTNSGLRIQLLARGPLAPTPFHITATLVPHPLSPTGNTQPHTLSPTTLDQRVITPDTTLITLSGLTDAPPGNYDLQITSSIDPTITAPRAVWIEDRDPALPRPIRVIQLSDLHAGKHPQKSNPKIRRILAEVNALAPDLVLVTGDVADDGEVPADTLMARDFLLSIDAPILVINGGHDLGVGLHVQTKFAYGPGWENYAAMFHPYLSTSLTFAGWDFIGFDTGPGAFLLGALDRGVSSETIQAIRTALIESKKNHRQGTILFSHAPTRSTFHNYGEESGLGAFGHMMFGGAALERAILDAAQRGQRVLHLAGHTHWAEAFEARPSPRGLSFHRWPIGAISPCLTPMQGNAALITTQSVSQIGVPLKRTATGYGFTELRLGAGSPLIAFHHDWGTTGTSRCKGVPKPAN